jgi:hypothetical protein
MDELSSDWKEGYSPVKPFAEYVFKNLFDSVGYPSIVTANTSGIYGYNIQIVSNQANHGWVIRISRNGGGFAICR